METTPRSRLEEALEEWSQTEPETHGDAEHDEQTINAYRQAALCAQDFYRHCAMAVMEFNGPRALAFECWLLAMGWVDILGVDSQEALARKWNYNKANVNKLVTRIQSRTDLPPMIGQRRAESREKFRAVRKSQLKS